MIALGFGSGPTGPLAPPAPPAPPAPLIDPAPACSPVFACQLADGREVSLCQSASDPLALQYSFGKPGAPWPQ